MSKKDVFSPAVLEEIRKYEDRSERLIAFLQMGFVIIMGLFYTISPKGFDETSVVFRPVPTVIGIYVPILIVRAILSFFEKMRGIALHIFTFLDIAIIISLIWVYHIQYQSDPAISLKAPTYVFLLVFIAIRSLRFRANYLVTALLTSLIGWVGLLVYSIMNLGGASVTSSFVDYATNNAILIGAEVEKMIGIVLVGIVLYLGVHRSKQHVGVLSATRCRRSEYVQFF